MKLQNIFTALRYPRVAKEYACWQIQRQILRRPPEKFIRDRIKIKGFTGFSEYLAVENFLSDEEYYFFENVDLGAGCVIDIGANMGVVSLFLARRFPDRKIYAVEASPHTVRSLRENIELNQARNVAASECAISDSIGTVRFNADSVSRGTASIASGDCHDAIIVPCTTLDSFVEQNDIFSIAFLKIDVEGFEALVFQGGHKTLECVRPQFIYFEICPRLTVKAGIDPKRAATVLLEHGYSLYTLGLEGNLVPADLTEIAQVDYANWVARAEAQ